ncbi:MAG: hypothetical protein ACR2GY_05915 [Phycisphaerales bacterium]
MWAGHEQQRNDAVALLGARKRRAPIEHEDPGALAPYITRPMTIYAQCNGRSYKARVRRNGWIEYGNHLYRTPSGAGKAVRKRSTNGWVFWSYRNAYGQMVALRALRE